MKDLSNKNQLWLLIFTLPPVFYTMDLFFDKKEFTLTEFFFYMLWSVIGVVLGYLFSAKLLSKYQYIRWVKVIGLFLLILLVFIILVVLHLTALRELQPFVSDALVLPLIVSAVTFSAVASKQ